MKATRTKNQLRNERGAAMIAVLSVMALFILMGLALLLASSSLMAAANEKLQQEHCYALAKTFALAMRDQLDATDAQGPDSDRYITKIDAQNDTPGVNPLVAAACTLSEKLSASDNPADATLFQPTAAPLPEGMYGKISLLLRRADYAGEGADTGVLPGGSSYDCLLYITARAERVGRSYDYTTVYARRKDLEKKHFLGDREVVENSNGTWDYAQGGAVLEGDVEAIEVRYVDTEKTKYSFWYRFGG